MAKIGFSFALSVATNGPAFRTGDSLVVSVVVDNPGLATTVDFYFGALLPDGDTVVFSHNSRALINFMSRAKAGNAVVTASKTGCLEFDPDLVRPGHGSCFLTCHGSDHGPKSY